ncbi:hypothetical protein [Deinococcus ruber]|uniref:Uncharacterized protein n=1 Tax=Deinococcus ruber TaxID=1848197 RepID=A0A918F9Q7_9DEIO|nr:hypothetical protein [Deinococcus ruber]GGR18930.1 hypothetical protein GCM10008957_34490 [Deinococcus ruber]
MPDLANLTPLELADLLQDAYAADHDLPGDHLTDPVLRYDLAWLLDHDEDLKLAVITHWLEPGEELDDPEELKDMKELENAALYWLDAEFFGQLELPDREED